MDRRLNCAAEICCTPNLALKAKTSLLFDLGCPEDCVDSMAQAMVAKGICFMPIELAQVIAEIADHPDRVA